MSDLELLSELIDISTVRLPQTASNHPRNHTYYKFMRDVIASNGNTIPFDTVLYKCSEEILKHLHNDFKDGGNLYEMYDWSTVHPTCVESVCEYVKFGHKFSDYLVNVLSKLPLKDSDLYLRFRDYNRDDFLRKMTYCSPNHIKLLHEALCEEFPTELLNHYTPFFNVSSYDGVSILLGYYKIYHKLYTPIQLELDIHKLRVSAKFHMSDNEASYLACMCQLVPELVDLIASRQIDSLNKVKLVEALYHYDKLDLMVHLPEIPKKVIWDILNCLTVDGDFLTYLTMGFENYEEIAKQERERYTKLDDTVEFLSWRL